jgi:ATP-dependent RNA helicase DOB1
MSGRAGRRGLDDRGIVIMMFDEKLEPPDAKNMIKGEADRLNSAFHLGYNMVLNLMRVEGISPEYMLERCFFQFQSAASVPELEGRLKMAQKELDAAVVPDEERVTEYFTLRAQIEELERDVREVTTHPSYALQFLQPGRLAHVRHEELDFGYGVIVRYQKRLPGKGAPTPEAERPQTQWILDVLLDCEAGSVAPSVKDVARAGTSSAPLGIRPCPPGEKGELLVVPVLLSTIHALSGVRLYMPPDVRGREARDQVRRNLLEVRRRFPGAPGGKAIPVLDPIKDMKITDESFAHLIAKIAELRTRMEASAIHTSSKQAELETAYTHKKTQQASVAALERELNAAHSVLQLDELKCRKRVLRRLGFTSDDDVVQKKGRVACEISTGDELLLTEMIFNNVFNELGPEQCAALLSCFVFDEKVSRVRSASSFISDTFHSSRRKRFGSRKTWPRRCASCRRRPGASPRSRRRAVCPSTRTSTWPASRSSSWTPSCSGAAAPSSPRSARCVAGRRHARRRARLTDPLTAAYGRVRGQRHSRLPASAGAAAPDGAGEQGDRQRRAGGQGACGVISPSLRSY